MVSYVNKKKTVFFELIIQLFKIVFSSLYENIVIVEFKKYSLNKISNNRNSFVKTKKNYFRFENKNGNTFLKFKYLAFNLVLTNSYLKLENKTEDNTKNSSE